MRNIWKNDDDQTRCDWAARQVQTAEVQTEVQTEEVHAQVPLILEPVHIAQPLYLHDLARRSPTTVECRQAYTVQAFVIPLDTNPKDMRLVQDQYDECLSAIHASCCQQFWSIFLEVHTYPVHVIDAVLHSVKRTFLKNSDHFKRFPPNRRKFLEKAATGGSWDFWSVVKHSVTIDLTGILRKPLASGTRSITFEFLDPVWAWLSVARRLSPEELHWRPAARHCIDPMYGGGVQYGECFRQACASCPPGGHPMCIGLHWDGTSGGGISSDPICIGCMNTNNCGAETQCCIGYIPKVSDQSRPEFAKTTDCTKLKFHIRQECCSAILRVLENAATRGVIFTLKNQAGDHVDRLLFPRLISMNFDQPEAQLFFGEAQTSCTYLRVTHKLTLRLPNETSTVLTLE